MGVGAESRPPRATVTDRDTIEISRPCGARGGTRLDVGRARAGELWDFVPAGAISCGRSSLAASARGILGYPASARLGRPAHLARSHGRLAQPLQDVSSGSRRGRLFSHRGARRALGAHSSSVDRQRFRVASCDLSPAGIPRLFMGHSGACRTVGNSRAGERQGRWSWVSGPDVGEFERCRDTVASVVGYSCGARSLRRAGGGSVYRSVAGEVGQALSPLAGGRFEPQGICLRATGYGESGRHLERFAIPGCQCHLCCTRISACATRGLSGAAGYFFVTTGGPGTSHPGGRCVSFLWSRRDGGVIPVGRGAAGPVTLPG